MQFLAKFSLKNPAAIMIISVLLIFGGIFSFATLKSDLLPDIEFPVISITSVYPGASSEDINRSITEELERRLKGIEDLSEMTSQSLDNFSRVQLSFPIGTNMDRTEQLVNDALSSSTLPDNVTTNVARFSFGAIPIVNVALFSLDDESIVEWAEEVLKPELQKINGVNSVALSGGPEEFLEIVVNKERAQQFGLNLNSIKDSVTQSFFSFPAGTIAEDAIFVPIRIDKKIESLAELRNIQFTSPITEETITLGEIASINIVEEQTEYARYNLKSSLSLLINKKQNANTVEVAEKFYEVLDSFRDQVDYAIAFDQAIEIKSSINELIKKGLLGALFASLAVLIFLRNFRATIIAVISIPLSLLIAAIFLKWLGITLNVMSLAGMTVAVGRVVDDSIIVIENIYRKIRLNPEGDRTQLTLSGTKEMINPIVSSTIASVVVFMPLGLVGGITSAFFLPFALTVVIALLASLIAAITLIPVLARFSFINMKEHTKDPFYVGWYEKTIRFALNRKLITVIIAFVLFIGSILGAVFGNLGFVFLPNDSSKIIQATVVLPATTTLQSTNDLSFEMEQALMEDINKFPKTFVTIGSFDFITGTSLPNRIQYLIELNEEMKIEEGITDVQERFEKIVSEQYPDTVVTVQELQGGGPPTNDNVDINIYSPDLNKLSEASKLVEQLMLNRNDLKNVKNNMEDTRAQWTVKLDPQEMNKRGISSFMILGIISDQTRPVDVGTYILDGTEQDIRLKYDREISGQTELENLQIFSQQGPVRLGDIALVSKGDVVTSIQKLDERIYSQVTAQIVGNDIAGVSREVSNEVAKLELPAGVTLEAGGGSDEILEVLIDILIAIGIAIGLVYLTMLIFFGKARIPFIILTSLLFVPIGSILALIIGREPLSMSAMIGLLMLVGIVVTNAIVLLDRINQNRASGLTINDALIEAGKTRIRPILMTALATIAALLPLAFTTPDGGLISRGLALVVIGGLTTSTLLTLVFLPVVYELAFYRTHKKEQQQKLL